MGYVGLTLAIVAADCGIKVRGVEIREETLDGLLRLKPHFFEHGLEAALIRTVGSGRLSFCKRLPADFCAGYYVVTIGTPLGGDGRIRLDMIEGVAADIACRLRDGDCVIMRSTVKVGATRGLMRPILQRSGREFHLAFCPERTVEGRALAELRELPQVIGADNEIDAEVAARLFRRFTGTVQIVSSLDTAEMIKLVDNVSRDVTFAFANEVAMLCDQFGVSAAEVIRTANSDYPRTNVAWPGPVAGPCLSKDPYILIQSLSPAAQQANLAAITRAGRETNERLAQYCREQVRGTLLSLSAAGPTRIALLGLAFKGRPETSDLRGSMAKQVLDALRAEYPRADFVGFDPLAAHDEVRDMGIAPCESIEEAVGGAQVAILLNNHSVFERADLVQFAARMDGPGLIYDFWSQFRPDEVRLPNSVFYVSFGNRAVARLPAEPSLRSREVA